MTEQTPHSATAAMTATPGGRDPQETRALVDAELAPELTAGALVTEDVGEHLGREEGAHRDVGVAQAGRDDPHQHLALAGLVELHVYQLEVLARTVDHRHRRLHDGTLGAN